MKKYDTRQNGRLEAISDFVWRSSDHPDGNNTGINFGIPDSIGVSWKMIQNNIEGKQ